MSGDIGDRGEPGPSSPINQGPLHSFPPDEYITLKGTLGDDGYKGDKGLEGPKGHSGEKGSNVNNLLYI